MRGKIVFLLLIFFSSIFSYAQFTPARGTFVVTPPYPNKLSDYGNPNLLKMNATITATDPSFTSKPIRLKLSIFYNQQLLMQGNDMVVGERPMYLTMGQMLILTQADLAPYFQQQNMRVSPVQYSQTLREGFYQFQLDILDYYTLQKIGLPLVASIYIMRYDPPQLYKPDNKAMLMDKGQGLVQFQWQPRQIAPNTEYEFTLVELQQEKFVDPMIEFTARRAGSYYYKTTTRMNTLNYGMMGEMPLRWGKSYAWQVRAITREGIDQVGTYEQDGYTDIRSFTYQKYCPVPTNIAVDVKSDQEATYSWDATPEHTSYILKITAADNPENTWLSVYPQEAKFEETQYRPDITYFYKLQGVCGEGKSEESGERSFTMLPRGQIKNFKCNEGDGKEPGGFETIANQKLLERDLQVGDTFTYSNWCKIAVKSVEKVGGYYKGKGVYRMPLAMFGFPLINIIFDSITVNTDLVALSGGFDAVNRGMKGVADVDEAINTATNIVNNVQGIVQDVKQLVEQVNQFLNNYTGTQEDKQQAKELQEKTDNISKSLINDPKLPDSIKTQVKEAQEKAVASWDAYKKGIPCGNNNTPPPSGSGPYIENIFIVANDNFDCHKDAINNQASTNEKATTVLDEQVMIEFAEKMQPVLIEVNHCLDNLDPDYLRGAWDGIQEGMKDAANIFTYEGIKNLLTGVHTFSYYLINCAGVTSEGMEKECIAYYKKLASIPVEIVKKMGSEDCYTRGKAWGKALFDILLAKGIETIATKSTLFLPAKVGTEIEEFAKGKALIMKGLLDDIYNAQKAIINKWKNSIADATALRKGNFGEMASDAYLAEKGFQPLHTRITNIDAPAHQGIDGVFKKGDEYFIVEAKYKGTATLSTLSNGIKQMSDEWIKGNNRLINAVGKNNAEEILGSNYKKLLAEIASDGTVIYKELDSKANVINIFTP